MGENELKLWMYFIYFWILVRITSLKSVSFDIGGRGTFVEVMGGWNCLLRDWEIIYGLWLLLLLLGLLAGLYLVIHDKDSVNLYKRHLLKHKIGIDIGVNLAIVIYCYISRTESESL